MESALIVFGFLFTFTTGVASLITGDWFVGAILMIAFLGFAWVIFKDSMNLVQRVGRIYWIFRDNGLITDPMVSIGFMRMVDPPWLRGKGPQFRFGKYTFQIGWCSAHTPKTEDEGILAAMDGRELEMDPKDIRKWNGSQPVQEESTEKSIAGAVPSAEIIHSGAYPVG